MQDLARPLYYICLFFTFSLVFSSCADEVGRSLEAPATAFGKANEVAVVADQALWEGTVGDTFRNYFGSAYLILPQPEPIFDLRHYTPEQLSEEPIRKELRTYILLGNVDDGNSATSRLIVNDIGSVNIEKSRSGEGYKTKVGRDKWAQGQLLIYLYGFNDADLIENIRKNFPAASKRINDADRKQIEASTFQAGENRTLAGEIQGKMGVNFRLPADYVAVIKEPDLVWLRKETDFASSNIMLHKIPYTDKSQLTKEGIKSIRDSLGRKYVSTEIEGTYMRINDIDLPMFTKVIEVNNNYTLEARGIWEIVNDFMGGSFLSYLILNTEKNELLFVDGFIHAPGKKKRERMQRLELVLASIEF
ncbi:MAG: DUF4837 family protein [Bacteroidota bacterium]